MSESRQSTVAVVMLLLAVPIGAGSLVSCSADLPSSPTASTDSTEPESLSRVATNTAPVNPGPAPVAPVLVSDPIAEEIAAALRDFAARLDDLVQL